MNPVTDPIRDEFMRAFGLYNSKDYAAAIASLKSVFSKYPDHDLAHQALFRLFSACRITKVVAQEVDFMQGIIHGNFEERCKKVAGGWLADFYAQQGDMKSAEEIILLSPKGSLSERELLLDLIIDYASMGDKENANRIAELMRARHHDKDVEEDIKIALESESDFELEKGRFSPEPMDILTEDILKETILANNPNPFNYATSIFYYVNTSGLVEVKVFNILGQKVRTLVSAHKEPGCHRVVWDGKDEIGNVVPSGIYLINLKTLENTKTIKVSFMK